MKEYAKKTIETYDSIAEDFTRNVKTLFPKKAMGLFSRMLTKGSSILDLGCGSGKDSEYFNKKGFKVTGIDLSKKLIAIARKGNSKIRFHVMDILDLSFHDGTFDGVWANASLLHISKEDQHIAFFEIHRVLKEDGILYVSVKLGEGEGLEEDKRYGRRIKFYSYHTLISLKEFLEEDGFEMIDSWIEEPDDPYLTHSYVQALARRKIKKCRDHK